MRRAWLAAGLTLAVVMAGACGGDDDDDSEATPDDETTQTTSKPAGGGDDGVLEVGAVFSLTGGGGVYGPLQKQGAELAVETLKAAGGVQVKLTIVDDASDKAQSAQQTQTLIQDKVVALLGPTLSNSAVAAHPIAANAKTPMLAVSTTGFDIVGPGCTYCDGWIFRDSLGEADAIPTNMKVYVEAKKPKRASLLFPNDDKFSADGAQVVKQNVAALGIQLVEAIEFTKNETDLAPYVTKAVQAKPDVIFITSLGGIPAKIMNSARELGFKGDFLGGNGFNSPAVVTQAGAAGKGAQSASAYHFDNDFQANAAFVTAYKAKYNADPDQFAAQAYTGVMILADAASRAKLTYKDVAADRAALRDALEATDLETPLGPFKFTKDHDVSQTIWIQAMDGVSGYDLVTSVPPAAEAKQ